MAKPEEIQVIVNLTVHSLQALRAVNGKIEAGGECVLENKPSLEALLGAVAPAWKTEGIKGAAAVWPDGAKWHLSTDTEAMLDRSPESLRAIASAAQKDPRAAMAYVSCNAGDGGTVTSDGMDKWLVAGAPGDALAKISGRLSELKIESDGAAPAAFPMAAAISAALRAAGKGSVALWELGTDQSNILLVTGSGVEAVVPCEVGMGVVFEAVQVALRLKFRGAGERLFFNETYDFTEPGPKVGASVGAKVKLALDQLPPSGNPPALVCFGVTGKQAWFVREVAAAAGTTAWAPDVGKLAAELGLKFSDSAVEASFSPGTAGLLQVLSSRIRSSDAWRPAWVSVEAQPEEVSPAPIEEPEPEPLPEPAPRAPAAPVRAKPTIAPEAGATAAPQRAKATLSPKAMAAPLPPGAAPAPRAPMSIPASIDPPAPPSAPLPAPAAPRPEAPPAPGPATMKFRAPPKPVDTRPPSFSRPGFLMPDPDDLPPPPPAPGPGAPAAPPMPPAPAAAKGAPPAGPTPPPAVTALPFEIGKIKAGQTTAPFTSTQAPFGSTQAPFTTAPFPEAQKSKAGFYIGLGVAAAIVFAVIAFVLDARMEKAKAFDLEQQEELAHHVAEQRLKEAEEAQKQEAERANKELQSAIEITRKQTEEQTRHDLLQEIESERLAKLPGTILVATTPAGAMVSIDGAAPVRSPVKLEGVQPGRHHLVVTMAGHDTVEQFANVKGSKTTDLGTIALQTSLGALDLSSTPDSLDFVVHAAADPNGVPLRFGKTPATFEDMPHGDYIVTFSRPGCHDHVVKVSVAKGGTSPVDTKYLDGSLELTSDPSGAWVDKDGERLGSTPLSIRDLAPKHAVFMLTLPGYDPTPITCDIPEGQTLKLEAQLLRRDRVFNQSEVKTPPESRETPPPVLTSAQRKQGAEVLISFVVRLDGSVSDVTVLKTTDDEVGRRCKAAVEGWRYRAATAADDRLVDSRIEMPFKFPPGGP